MDSEMTMALKQICDMEKTITTLLPVFNETTAPQYKNRFLEDDIKEIRNELIAKSSKKLMELEQLLFELAYFDECRSINRDEQLTDTIANRKRDLASQ